MPARGCSYQCRFCNSTVIVTDNFVKLDRKGALKFFSVCSHDFNSHSEGSGPGLNVCAPILGSNLCAPILSLCKGQRSSGESNINQNRKQNESLCQNCPWREFPSRGRQDQPHTRHAFEERGMMCPASEANTGNVPTEGVNPVITTRWMNTKITSMIVIYWVSHAEIIITHWINPMVNEMIVTCEITLPLPANNFTALTYTACRLQKFSVSKTVAS